MTDTDIPSLVPMVDGVVPASDDGVMPKLKLVLEVIAALVLVEDISLWLEVKGSVTCPPEAVAL